MRKFFRSLHFIFIGKWWGHPLFRVFKYEGILSIFFLRNDKSKNRKRVSALEEELEDITTLPIVNL